MDAANLDGAGYWAVFRHIGIPMGKPGIIAALVLSFLEGWSAVEQPMTFLRVEKWWPLSLRIPMLSGDDLSLAMGAALVALVPAVLVFRLGQEYLELGLGSATMEQ